MGPGALHLRSTTDCAHSSLRTTKTVLPQAVVEKGAVCMWGGQPACQCSSQILAAAPLLWEVGAPSLQTTLFISVWTSLTWWWNCFFICLSFPLDQPRLRTTAVDDEVLLLGQCLAYRWYSKCSAGKIIFIDDFLQMNSLRDLNLWIWFAVDIPLPLT